MANHLQKIRLKKKIIISVFGIFIFISAAQGQLLISLLLGDKLNSGKIEFGLDGGANWNTMSTTPDATLTSTWNLGFYFDCKLNEKLYIHTGVVVKSRMGTGGLKPYQLNDAHLDSVFQGGNVTRNINYFNVPGLVRYRFIDYFHVEGGIQLGLRYTAYDIFKNEVNEKDDLTFKNDIKDNYTRLDAGVVAGLGYKFLKGTGMTLTGKYYYGLVDVDKVSDGSQYNSSIYINLSVPVGRGKAEKRAAEKAKMQQEK